MRIYISIYINIYLYMHVYIKYIHTYIRLNIEGYVEDKKGEALSFRKTVASSYEIDSLG